MNVFQACKMNSEADRLTVRPLVFYILQSDVGHSHGFVDAIKIVLLALYVLMAGDVYGQGGGNRAQKPDDEFRMSHLQGEAGDLIGLVLPERIVSPL